MTTRENFNLLEWSGNIPLLDEVWLGMQARNLAIVDLAVLRDLQDATAAELMKEEDRDSAGLLMTLSALSQMWIFSLYEFLRTWRERADELLEARERYDRLKPAAQPAFLEKLLGVARGREGLVRSGLSWYSEQFAKIGDDDFIGGVRAYLDVTNGLFQEAALLRVTLAKHEIPKTGNRRERGMIADTPGYGQVDRFTGSMFWFISLKDGSQMKVDRQELANTFMGITDEADVEEVLASLQNDEPEARGGADG